MDLNLAFFKPELINPIVGASLAPGEFRGFGWFTNTLLFGFIVMLLILWFTRMATRKMELIPNKKQNFVEFVIEFLYNQVAAIVGDKIAPKAFPLLATIFLFVLCSNWAGLVPGVGTAGFVASEEYLVSGAPISVDTTKVFKANKEGLAYQASEDTEVGVEPYDKASGKRKVYPFTTIFRPPTSDLNFTLSLACVFMVVWTWITFREVGFKGFIDHTFGPKGGLEGFMKYCLIPIFIFVGLIEIVSIAARPVSLSLRLFGNVFAGETLLHTMLEMGRQFGLKGIWLFLLSVILPLPFYFMELLVGVLQAMVFSLLCAVFIKLSTEHDEEHH